MHRFLNIVRYEYRMSTRRWGMWLAYGLVFAIFFILPILTNREELIVLVNGQTISWQFEAGILAFQLNLLTPVIAGIVLADRMVRDYRLGVDELLISTPLKRWTYILGKYTGGLLSVLTPVALIVLSYMVVFLAYGAPLAFAGRMLAAFALINFPAFAFVTIFSLAFPLVIPVRIYQVLFTGYWFWGNFLNPEVFPSLSGTLLTPGGKYAFQAFFGGFPGGSSAGEAVTASQAVLNLILLAACVLAGMVLLDRYLAWQAQRA